MFQYRRINVNKDRDRLLEFHCRINYESETPYARKVPYEQYRQKWFSTTQPETYLSDLSKSMKNKRTIAEILEDNDTPTGYLWVTFADIQGYDMTIAEIMDIIVAPEHQRRGIGLSMLTHIEKIARERGATFLRSDTGIENVASQELHEKFGFRIKRIEYEKILQ